MSKTIQETIQELHFALRDYIEATYHISSPALIRQRRKLLHMAGVISQVPYIESTPRYKTGPRYSAMSGLSPFALRAFELLCSESHGQQKLLYDPPYLHQSESVLECLTNEKNLVVMTGTGSGKTESFLLPILGKLAREAGDSPLTFNDSAVRSLLLYPMNALVNDQLGRLRGLFGDPRLVAQFKRWAGRPPRFARYTSRTPYAGVRNSKKDSTRLRSFEEFYVAIEQAAAGAPSDEQEEAANLLRQLKIRGKWPAKPSLADWFGQKGAKWQRKDGTYARAVTLADDSELITRDEIQRTPPDLLVTNYSMLEYMLMRPIERPIFDRTKDWLKRNPREKFLVVLDEAHLYRGAAGAEVGLLLRRLRNRLEIETDQFQVICATASFSEKKNAPSFGSQLSGVDASTFVPISGTLDTKSHAAAGSLRDAEVLSSVNLDQFYSEEPAHRASAVAGFLAYRGISPGASVEKDLFAALNDFSALGLLINVTMAEATPVAELGGLIFPQVAETTASKALTVLMAFGSVAREESQKPGLLPCRIHNFFRGLPGLWVCMDPDCTQLSEDEKTGFCGRLYSQPREQCLCQARVLELFTCRHCGTAYARAYSDDIDSPRALWSEPGRRLRIDGSEQGALLPLDLLLEASETIEGAEPFDYDLETGQLNPLVLGERTRTVHVRKDRITPPKDEDGEADTRLEIRGQFVPCAVCGETARFGRSTVQDHQTKGDQPFQALVARQLQVQPPSPAPATAFAPLRGRKVLVFSDSRQVAARLAPNLQMYSVRDSLRSLIVWGYRALERYEMLRDELSLEDIYLAVLLAADQLKVRLRPEVLPSEPFTADQMIAEQIADGALNSEVGAFKLALRMRADGPPSSLLDSIVKTVQDRFLGLEALALGSIAEISSLRKDIAKLPALAGLPDTPEAKASLVRAWLRCWRRNGFWLNSMPKSWWMRPRSSGTSIKGQKGAFKAMQTVLGSAPLKKAFEKEWLPTLLRLFTSDVDGGYRRLEGKNLTLLFGGEWRKCRICTSVHRPVFGISHCIDCGGSSVDALVPETDEVFQARKGYYRKATIDALAEPPIAPIALIAAEHTAQLNAPQNEDVYSKAEENELLFQDIKLSAAIGSQRQAAVDVLSSTTTMEVGIDIGALTGVALRNMPPSRANYQQRAGRAGRRGNAVATVVAFGSADSHDEHYFSKPDGMIRGKVVDPKLTLENFIIARRHVRAFLLQRYHQARIPKFDPTSPPDLFSVLGTVSAFRSGEGVLNDSDFEAWLTEHETALQEEADSWLPIELSAGDRKKLLDEMVADCISSVRGAIAVDPGTAKPMDLDADEDDYEEEAEEGDDSSTRSTSTSKLLDRLLYHGVLPRYAFPTDVASFNVFDLNRSKPFRPIMRFAPSQGLPIALSQYAPGKQVWIAGKCYTSGAIYSSMPDERFAAFQHRRLYMECRECRFAKTIELDKGVDRGETQDCPACGTEESFGPAQYWLRPPGFAHPVDVDEATSPDDMPDVSYATRAKLVMPTPPDEGKWIRLNDRLRLLSDRTHLLVSNTGPDGRGYSYCSKCGRIEATTEPNPIVFGTHRKPFPDEKEPHCDGTRTVRKLVLGTDFITDIALFSVRVAAPIKLKPGRYVTDVAMRTLSEALAKAACRLLEIEPGELMAEFRPALTPAGQSGLEAEIFLYDTLPGGAGFSAQLVGHGDELFAGALELMASCPDNCDSSCYRCLRSFKNKFEHGLLDRHVGRYLAEYLLTGNLPDFDRRRITGSTSLLFSDLKRQPLTGIDLQRNVVVSVPNIGPVTFPIVATVGSQRYAVVLSAALSADHPADAKLAQVYEEWDDITIVPVNELLVRSNLPAATRSVLSALTGPVEA